MTIASSNILWADYLACKESQSSSVNTDTEGAIESVRIKRFEFRENVRGAGDSAYEGGTDARRLA